MYQSSGIQLFQGCRSRDCDVCARDHDYIYNVANPTCFFCMEWAQAVLRLIAKRKIRMMVMALEARKEQA